VSKEPRTETVEGVTIVSRHGVERELIRMRKSVGSWPGDLKEQVAEFFCDSKIGNHYIIEVRTSNAADQIAPYLAPLRARSVLFMHGREMVGEVRV
jgi:hypothetical protein